MTIRKKRKLKKSWKPLVSVCAVLSIFISYSVFAFLFHMMNVKSLEFKFEDFVQNYSRVSDILTFTYGDPNLKMIGIIVPILFFAFFLYLRRESLFEKQYDDASEFGLHGTNKLEDPTNAINGQVLSNKNEYIPGDFKNSLKNVEEGIVLGKVPNENKLLIIHDGTEIDNKNVLVVGSPGSGKGQSYVITNIINIRTQSLIAIDPKGENYTLTHQLKRDQGYKVYTIDFVHFSEASYNPLDLILTDEDAQKVSKNIVSSSTKDGKEDFFSERAQKLLAALMVYIKATYPKVEANMATLITVYNTSVKDPEKCEKFLELLPKDHPAYGLLTSVLDGLAGNTRASVIASFDSAIGIFQLSRIKEMTKKSDFTFDQFQDGKSILYVKIQVPSNPYRALTSVFFNQMIDRFYMLAAQNESNTLHTPVNFIWDEFPNIGKIDAYKEVLSTCRGLLMYMHTIIQDISQLQDDKLYGEKGARGIISTHDSQLILRVNEKETAKIISERFGKTTVKHKAESITISKGSRSVSKNDQFVERDLVTAGELLKMKKNQAYLLIAGHDVMEIEKAYQYEVYGDLLTKNREYNYHHSRKKLGYKDPLFTEDASNKKKDFSFEEYQKQHYGLSSIEQEAETKEQQSEVKDGSSLENQGENEAAESVEEEATSKLPNELKDIQIDKNAVQDFKNTTENVKKEEEKRKETRSHDDMLDEFEADFEAVEMLTDTSQTVNHLKKEMELMNSHSSHSSHVRS
ncbi:VirD4-like conjugal transfer protein, CD1115 family [Bacillus taeanensis]|uniref:TrsK protein n=1 Tax=Bacillus taeanensis TaxID=273032 RepID=A0A366XWB0_9BACI|nr:type IV secretory system conjugative DNA transfer family protein [Bacillus taeanensis]RBW68231.1 TrsK protein [Bacillus taeanensis]